VGELQLCEILASDAAMLQRVYRLRARVWAAAFPDSAGRGQRPDRIDPVARHWAILRDDEPIAAARLSLHEAIHDAPGPASFAGAWGQRLPAPIACLSRLVVDPAMWGRGLSRRLDQVRLEAADETGGGCAVAATLTGKRRVRQLESLGFRVVGLSRPVLVRTGSSGPSPVVLFRFLSAGRALHPEPLTAFRG
jgi:GNAT superfamily N-acetyltransferase